MELTCCFDQSARRPSAKWREPDYENPQKKFSRNVSRLTFRKDCPIFVSSVFKIFRKLIEAIIINCGGQHKQLMSRH